MSNKYSLFLRTCIIICILSAIACHSERSELAAQEDFDREKWHMKEGMDYPFRYQMVNSILYNDSIRSLNKEKILDMLGDPSYIREGHLYYRVEETRLLLWKLHTRTLVVKLKENDFVDWIKLHE